MTGDDTPAPDAPEDDVTDAELPDEQLLARLRDLFARAEQPPAWAVESARASLDLRSLDLELALLTWDSDVDEPMVAVRGAGTATPPRALSFEAGGLTVEVEVTAEEDGLHLVGQLEPPQPGRVEVQQASGEPADVVVDEYGRFSASGLAPGLVRLVCRPDGGSGVVTDWVRLD